MITLEEALEVHFILIERFGGSEGLRDKALLQSALVRPYQTFDGADLYPNSIDKAAAIIQSIVQNHPFIDGNKRNGYVLARLLLRNAGLDIYANEDQKYKFVIQISKGEMEYEQIRDWLKKYTKTRYSQR